MNELQTVLCCVCGEKTKWVSGIQACARHLKFAYKQWQRSTFGDKPLPVQPTATVQKPTESTEPIAIADPLMAYGDVSREEVLSIVGDSLREHDREFVHVSQ
jgi:hypothetical protein